MLEFLLDPYNYLFWVFIGIVIILSITIIWWPFNIYIQFSYINAKLEAIGNPYINQKDLFRLIESKNLIEFRDSLNNVKDYDISGENSGEIQKSLDKNYMRALKQTKRDSSKKIIGLFNVFYEKNDLEYLKKIIKNKVLNSKYKFNNFDEINTKDIKKLIKEIDEAESESINEILIKYGFDSNLKNFQYKTNSDFIFLDNIFDNYIIKKFRELKLPNKCQKGKEDFLNYMIDIKNIKNILRGKNINFDEETCNKLYLGDGKEISYWKYQELSQCKDANQIITYLEGTSYYNSLKDSIEKFNIEKSTQIFEHTLDEYFLKILKELSIQNYVHIGPILRYLISKEYEITNLKIVSKGIEENINSDIIKNNLIIGDDQ